MSVQRRVFVLVCIAVAIAAAQPPAWLSHGSVGGAAAATAVAAQPADMWEERVLATLPPGVDVKRNDLPFSLLVSPDARRVAYIARYDEGNLIQEAVVYNDHRGPPASFILHVVLSSDGSKVAYLASPRENVRAAYLIVGDRRDQVQFTEGATDPHWVPVFSPDGRKLAYKVETATGKHAIKVADVSDVPGGVHPDTTYTPLSAEVGPEFTDVDGPQFSPDGSRVTYAAVETGTWYIVVDGRRGPRFADAATPVFSPDGQTVAYRATDDKRKYFAVSGEERGVSFDWVGRPSFSPDGRQLAYGALEGKRAWVLVGSDRRPAKHLAEEVVFSADGSHTAYWTRQASGNCEFIVIDDEAGPKFDKVGIPTFDPAARVGAYWARDGSRFLMVAGAMKSGKFDGVSRTRVFNSDGNLLGFAVLQGREVRWKVMRLQGTSTSE